MDSIGLMEEFRIEAVKEADEIAALPVHLRSMALENILRRLLIRGKSKQNTSININSRTVVFLVHRGSCDYPLSLSFSVLTRHLLSLR